MDRERWLPDLDADFVVVGAGVVGLAIAERLAARGTVVVVERNEAAARETSAHNTGIVHAGFLYETGSLKHRLCLEANPLVYEWCEAHGVRVAHTGKLVVALAAEDLDGLERVEARARANGVSGIRRLTGIEARALEPHIAAVAALSSETSGIIDQAGFAKSLESAARDRGVLFAFHHTVIAVERAEGSTTVHLRDAEGAESSLRAGVLVNSAGHGAPLIAALAGLPLDGDAARGLPPLRQRVNRGRYYDLVSPEFSRAVSRPVYPIPSGAADVQRHQVQAGGAGMHLSVDIDGVAHLGPDTEWLPDGTPLDYRVDDAPRAAFLAAGRRFLPSLRDEDITPGQVGYRPKIEVTGDTPPDFLIFRDGAYVHLGGIESPGLTSALAIARHVEGLV